MHKIKRPSWGQETVSPLEIVNDELYNDKF